MAEITAQVVKTLREKTGCGMMECKKALVETNGDFDEAVKLLREKGLAVAAKKADRIAAEGIVDIAKCDACGKTAMIEVNAETDFVAKNAEFQAFVKGCLSTILKNAPKDVEELLTMKFDDTDVTVADTLTDKIRTIGENMSIRRFVLVEGTTGVYIHGKGSIGVIAAGEASAEVAAKPEFAEMLRNVAMHVAGTDTAPAYMVKEEVPADVIENEKNILIAQIKNDPANAKKPDNIIEKMVSGRINKYYQQYCLLEQEYVKDDSMSVGKYVDSVAKEIGACKVTAFYRFEKGEGIQKREEDFAAEIAKLAGGNN